MITGEHLGWYGGLASALTERGLLVFGHDHQELFLLLPFSFSLSFLICFIFFFYTLSCFPFFTLTRGFFNSWLTEILESKQFWLNNLSIETKLVNKSLNWAIIIFQGHGKSEGPRAYAVSMEHVIIDIYRYCQWHRIILSALLKFRPKACITTITNQTIINMPKSSVRTPEISTGSTKLAPILPYS